MGRSNVRCASFRLGLALLNATCLWGRSSLKSDGGGVLLENVSITGGKRQRAPRNAGERLTQPQLKKGDAGSGREGSSSASDMVIDQDLPSGRPSKRNRATAADDDEAGESNRAGRRGQGRRNAPTGERRPRGQQASLDRGLQSERLTRPARGQ